MPERPPGHEALSARISRASRAALVELVREELHTFTERDVLQVLRHPFLSTPAVEEVLLSAKAMHARAVRKALALHPATPRPAALESIGALLWRELLDVGRSARTPMPVRRAANQRILEQMPRLSLGEKTALARLADRPLLPVLLEIDDVRVFAALLGNPRLTQDDLVAWITVGTPSRERLAQLAAEPRWNRQPAVRGALFATAATPRAAALALLAGGTRAEWRRIMEDPKADRLLCACARRLYEESTAGVDRSVRSA